MMISEAWGGLAANAIRRPRIVTRFRLPMASATVAAPTRPTSSRMAGTPDWPT
jgi:hypothetical protein